jgi:hypothetical protein
MNSFFFALLFRLFVLLLRAFMAWPAILNLLYLHQKKWQPSDILGDRRYAAREDATEREFDRYGQSTLYFFRHTWLCGTMGPTSRVEEY